jgi:phospholipase C
VTDQSSVTSFIENNWLHGQRIGHGSFDVIAGNLAGRNGLLDFNVRPNYRPVILNPITGAVVKQ